MAEPILTDIDRDPDWWRDWFEEDYSWDALARLDKDDEPVHPWRGWVVIDQAQCVPADEAPDGADTRLATLQDYWRADPGNDWRLRSKTALRRAGELLEGVETPDGRTWHIVHVPPGPRPGKAVDAAAQARWFKAWVRADAGSESAEAWAKLDSLLSARLEEAAETEVDILGNAKGPDRRAQLDGAACTTLPTLREDDASPIHLSARRSVHLARAIYGESSFGPAAHFDNARFAGDAGFISASFAGDAWFESASFAGNASFNSASFAGNASFNSASFAGNASFNSASFAEYAWFNSASFAGNAWFNSASFARNASFNSASFAGNASFNSASFAEYAWFESASFAGNAWFNSASFAEYADFESASFLRGANFQRGSPPALPAGRLSKGGQAHALEYLRDKKPNYSNADYALIMSDGAARRETGAFPRLVFNDGLALGRLQFHDRVFGQQPDFTKAAFHGPLDMYQAELHDGVIWQNANFGYAPRWPALSWIKLAARLASRPGFGAAPTTAELAAWRSKKADQRDRAADGDGAPSVADRVRKALWMSAADAFDAYVARNPLAWKAANPVPGGRFRPSHAQGATPDVKTVRANAAKDAPEFERAYRRLKLLMRQQGAHLDEQRFFALELRARQARDPKTDKDVKRWEIWAAWAYGALADYGASVLQPLRVLAVVWVLAFTGYAALGAAAGVLPEAERAGLASQAQDSWRVRPQDRHAFVWVRAIAAVSRYKVERDLRPVAPLAGPLVFAAEISLAPVANPIRHHPWAMRLQEKGDGWAAAFSALRLIHRLCALPLLFLFALALRRRFQMG